MAPATSPQVTPEELDMLAEAITALEAGFNPLLQNPPHGADWLALAARYGDQLGNLIHAAGHLGMVGLQEVLGIVQLNVLAWPADASMPGTMRDDGASAMLHALMAWPSCAVAWLAEPSDELAARALANVAASPAWPYPAEQALADQWGAALATVQVLKARPTSSLPRQALPEHMSLAIPDDIDAQVLDSLLSELPQHAQALAGLLQGLEAGLSADDLAHAQRVAHTLKGAGHTVGISGLAHLTHALEEILSTLSRSPQARTPQLCLAMAQAADCLEEMGEALAHAGPPPQDSQATCQALLDWIHQYDASASAAAEDPAQPHDTTIDTASDVSSEPLPSFSGSLEAPRRMEPQDAAAPSTPPETATASLRLAATQVDALLNLAVEGSIHSSRLKDRVARLELDLQLQRSGSRQWRVLAAELEQLVDVRGLGLPGGRRDRLDALEMDQYGELHILSRRLVEAAQDSQAFVAGFERELGQLRELLSGSERIQSELRRMVEHTRMVEVASVSPRLQRTVRQAARILGKSVQLQIRGEASLLDRQLLDTLLDPLMHLLRNAVDHGIEPPPQRQQSGKPAQGTITLEFLVDGARLDILCADDGAGLSVPDLRAAATAQGLLAEGADLSDALARQLILLPGFSTRRQATLISGRGIGMDVVSRAIESLRGTLTLDSVPGRGLSVRLSLPTRMSMAKVMVSRSANHVLALSERNIQELLPVSDALHSRADGQLQFMLRDTPIAAWRLEQLLQLPPMALRLAGRNEAVLIVLDERRERHAILAPEISESRQVFIKTVGQLTNTSTGVDGVTILGDGAIASVIDLPDLLRAHLAGQHADQLPSPPGPIARPSLCLVVDDSLSVRNSTSQLLQDTGYEVLCARDGMEALDILQNCTPDIVLADLEMPRMNGLELTRALRGREQTRLTPVLMITSRFTARHQALAYAAGVSAFQAKPFSDDELLQVIGDLLAQPGRPDEPDSIMPAWTNDSNPASP